MLLWIISWLVDFGIHVPSVFSYISTRAFLAAILSFLLVLLAMPRWMIFLERHKVRDVPRAFEEIPALAKEHAGKNKTPSMGGVVLFSSMALALLFFMDFSWIYAPLFLFVMSGSFFAGLYDDVAKWRGGSGRRGLSEKAKYLLFGALGLSTLLYLLFCDFLPFKMPELHLFLPKVGGNLTLATSEMMRVIFLPFCKYPWIFFGVIPTLIWIIFSLVVFVGSTQAVNLTDGLDGLAAGSILAPGAVMGALAFLSGHLTLAKGLSLPYIQGAGEVTIAMAALLGAALAFLWYNGYPAQIFMGDSGSLVMGAMVGLAAILIRREFWLAISGAILVAEALSVILQRLFYKWKKRRIFLCAPIHYHFQMKGTPESKVVLRFWIVSWLFGMIAITLIKFQ